MVTPIWRIARILEEVLDVREGTRPHVDVQHQIDRGSAPGTSLSRCVNDVPYLLVRRTRHTDPYAVVACRSVHGRDSGNTSLKPPNEAHHPDVDPRRRNWHSNIVSDYLRQKCVGFVPAVCRRDERRSCNRLSLALGACGDAVAASGAHRPLGHGLTVALLDAGLLQRQG
jgi:hypothetical protein